MLSQCAPARTTATVAAALAVGVLAIAGPAQANPGDLDPGFGTGGIVISNLGTVSGSSIEDIAVQADGKVVALERGYGGGVVPHLLRYLPDGTLDPSFSGDGIAPIPSGIFPGDLALQPDGKILLSGGDATASFAVARFLPNGDLDQGFDGDSGTANGVVHADVTPGADLATSLAVDSQGRIVLAGLAGGAPDAEDVGVVRLLPDGRLDKSFNGNGKLFFDSVVEAFAWAVTTQSDGKIVVVGAWGKYPNANTMIQRFTESGAPDTFGYSDGRKVLDLGGSNYANAVAVQPGGELLVGSRSGAGGKLVRLSANGELDTSFASGGIVSLGYMITGIALAPDGKIVLGGEGMLDGTGAFAAERRNSDGTADATFAGGAPALTRVIPGEPGGAVSVAVAPDGRVVTAGETGQYPGTRGAIVRYQGVPSEPGPTPATADAAPAPATVDAALALTGLRVTHRAFTVARTATPRVGRAQAAGRRTRGTAFVFRLSRAATVTIRISRRTRTVRTKRVATLKRLGRPGGNRVKFSGRVGRRVLRIGRYRATLVGVDRTGSRSEPRTVTFRILRG
jgi:uncharacterized delta-60 repeat protein